MFQDAAAFNGDVSNWNTGAVTDMSDCTLKRGLCHFLFLSITNLFFFSCFYGLSRYLGITVQCLTVLMHSIMMFPSGIQGRWQTWAAVRKFERGLSRFFLSLF